MPELSNDVFISYSHLDNRILSGGVGWVDAFYRELNNRLGEYLGRSPRIWKDSNPAGHTELTGQILENLERSKVLVAIFSPAYLGSKLCLQEVETFRQAAGQEGKEALGAWSRFIPVIKTETPQEFFPPPYQGLIGHQFYHSDRKTHTPQQYSPLPGGYKHVEFLETVSRIAYEIAGLVMQLSHDDQAEVEPAQKRTFPSTHPPSKEDVSSKRVSKSRPSIFISYRREDTEGHAGRLFDRLSGRFGEGNVFMDIDTIKPGDDFVDAVQKAVGSCSVLIALIGKRWVSITDEAGDRRLDNPEDFVRLEITTALERKIPVIPALVQGTTMPKAKDLPEELKSLSRRQAQELSSTRWNYDVDLLIKVLEKTLGS